MATTEVKELANIVTQAIRDDLLSPSTQFPPALIIKMEKLLEHVTICNHDYEYSCHHIPRWYKCLKPDASDEDMRLAGLLGWIFQFTTSFMVSLDDIVDKSDVRFDRPSWYGQHKNSGNLLYDIQLMQSWAYFLLKKFLANHPLYNQLLDFMSSTWYSFVKSCRMEMDFEWKNLQALTSGLDEDSISVENYNVIAREKPSAVHVWLNMAWSLTLAGYDINEYKEVYENTKEICSLVGAVGQTMDDFYDCFTEECSDERYVDIKNGQFTWLLVKARELCSVEQWQKIKMHYGRDDIESINAVMGVYRDIDIPTVWMNNKQIEFAKIREKANELFKPEHEIFKQIALSYIDYIDQVFVK